MRVSLNTDITEIVQENASLYQLIVILNQHQFQRFVSLKHFWVSEVNFFFALCGPTLKKNTKQSRRRGKFSPAAGYFGIASISDWFTFLFALAMINPTNSHDSYIVNIKTIRL